MYEKIPKELKNLTQWGCFRKIWSEKKQKFNKIPINAWDGTEGRTNDTKTWSDFNTALKAIDKFNCDGLAFYFANGYAGLDLDNIEDEIDKIRQGDRSDDNLVMKARKLTRLSYAELSLSGKGIHCIFKGKITGKRRRMGDVEMYDSGRFFAITGNAFEREPILATLNREDMQKLYEGFFGKDKIIDLPTQSTMDYSHELSTEEIIAKIQNSSSANRFDIFMNGGWEQYYQSQSEADLAFANLLAFWCAKDYQKMDEIFRMSAMYRPKFDEKHGAASYGERTLREAIGSTTNVYTPKREFNYQINFDGKKKDIQPHSWDDTGNADRFSDMWAERVRYSYIDKLWYVYNGSYWEADNRGIVQRCADKVVENMKNEKLVIPEDMDVDEAQKAWQKFLKKSRSNASKKAMLKEAEHRNPVMHEDFDKEIMELNTASGYVDLTSSTLHPHAVEKMFSQQTNAEFSDHVDCPEWIRFLNQIFDNDQELIHYLQKAVGYSATGSTREQVMFILYGNGRNGKSLFIDVLAEVLGTYAKTMNVSTIMVKSNSGVNSDIARLEGARMVISSEADEGKRLDEGLVKQLTGGDKIVARYLYGKEFEFEPRFKIWMATNHKPLIRGTDNGIWRRIILIPFNVQIPIEKVDKDLKFKLQRELSGILNWIVEGALMWQREGLNFPAILSEAVQEYRDEMDIINMFLNDCCEIGDNFQAPAGELFEKYRSWAEYSGEYRMSKHKFSSELKRRFEYKRKNSGRFYLGLKISQPNNMNWLTNG